MTSSPGFLCVIALAAVALGARATPAAAQSPDSASGLTTVKCDAAANSCDDARRTFTMPVLGAAGSHTVLSPSLRSTEVALDSDDSRVLIPGCTREEPGVFVCSAVHQYQHCRTLMFSSMVHSCRAPNPLELDVAGARAARPDEYDLSVDSNARVRVTRGDRGFGQARGKADVVLRIEPPRVVDGIACLERDRFLSFPTGPEGGANRIDATAACDAPIEFSFGPHEDDVLRAYDICETFAAWGSQVEESMEVLAAGLFHVRSDGPAFAARDASAATIVAPWVVVRAPLTIDCRD
jgi:hypothetical protein